jgi:hypothetical protein
MTKEERLAEIRAKIGAKIGWEQAGSIYRWYEAAKEIGCPNCGIDFRSQPDEYNIYPHFTGGCKDFNINTDA